MKITGPGKTENTKKASKTQKTGDGSFGIMLSGSEETEETPSTGTAHSITKVEALLVAQISDDPAEQAAKERMVLRADRLLDELDNIRLSMLTGSISVGHMIDLADVVASHKEGISDPELSAILDEIDLRAQIEIAKMRVSLDSLV